jgi:hypothetical protein
MIRLKACTAIYSQPSPNDTFHFVGFFRQEASERAGESRFPFCLADRLEPPDEIGRHFQSVRRQSLQVLEDVIADCN